MLEVEFPFYEETYHENLFDQKLVKLCQDFLTLHRKSITIKNLEIGAYLFMKTLITLSHTTIIEAKNYELPKAHRLGLADILLGYVTLKK